MNTYIHTYLHASMHAYIHTYHMSHTDTYMHKYTYSGVTLSRHVRFPPLEASKSAPKIDTKDQKNYIHTSFDHMHVSDSVAEKYPR